METLEWLEYDIDPFAIVHTQVGIVLYYPSQYMSIEKSSPRRPRSGERFFHF